MDKDELIRVLRLGIAGAGACTPWRHMGGEYCQHGYNPVNCPVDRARRTVQEFDRTKPEDG